MKKLIMVFGLFALTSCDPATLNKVLEGIESSQVLSQEEVARGLKEALNKGVDHGVGYLSKQDGFYKSAYKILLPEEAQQLSDKLKIVPGFDQVEKILVEKINRAAEDAVKKATPIFGNAIKQMTIRDAMDILLGEQNSATKYLNRQTYDPLYGEFQPVIVNSLNKFGALDYWTKAVKAYNSIPFAKKMNPKFDDYVATKALEAMFKMIEKEERTIRTDISHRTSDLLKKVFAKQD